MHLALANISNHTQGDFREITELDISNKSIQTIDDLEPCIELKKVNLSNNQVTNLGFLQYCKSITWINAEHNEIVSLDRLYKLTSLKVLKMSHNKLTDFSAINPLKNLCALVLNDNCITSVPKIKLPKLNTLILSRNQIEECLSVSQFPALKKLNLSRNKIRVMPVLNDNHNLIELRMNGNLISTIPEDMIFPPSLSILDLGNNHLRRLEDLQFLSLLQCLKSLVLINNPVNQLNGYAERLQELLPNLEILDGKRLDAPRKNKRIPPDTIQAQPSAEKKDRKRQKDSISATTDYTKKSKKSKKSKRDKTHGETTSSLFDKVQQERLHLHIDTEQETSGSLSHLLEHDRTKVEVTEFKPKSKNKTSVLGLLSASKLDSLGSWD